MILKLELVKSWTQSSLTLTGSLDWRIVNKRSQKTHTDFITNWGWAIVSAFSSIESEIIHQPLHVSHQMVCPRGCVVTLVALVCLLPTVWSRCWTEVVQWVSGVWVSEWVMLNWVSERCVSLLLHHLHPPTHRWVTSSLNFRGLFKKAQQVVLLRWTHFSPYTCSLESNNIYIPTFKLKSTEF